jgi:hypothetical protein
MNIGRLKEVPLREIWPHEERDFTPWLAQPENLSFLGDEIGVEFNLDNIRTEHRVGPFSIDILAEDLLGHKVVIENYLERTDHGHLGQCITYAAGIRAPVIIWIVKDVHDQHREAVEYLNRVSSDELNFFLVQLGAVKIGESEPAPMLDVIEAPNNWARVVREGSQGDGLSDTKLKQQAFWEDVRAYGEEHSRNVTKWRKPLPQHWYNLSIGIGGVKIEMTANTRTKQVTTSLYIDTGNKERNKEIYNSLFDKKDEIESELGELNWWELEDKRASIISKYADLDFLDEEQRAKAIKWLVDTTDAFVQTFAINRRIV